MNKINDRWSALSMKDRADLIKLYLESGITDLREIKKGYNSFETGGSKKGILDKEKIVRNVPAREWGPYRLDENYNEERGEGTNFKTAVKYYYDNYGHGLKNEELANKVISEFESLYGKEGYNEILDPNYTAYKDAISYRNHVEALKKYLGLPYNTNVILESSYQPTKSIGTDDKYYKFSSHNSNNSEVSAAIEDMVYSGFKEQQYTDNTLNTFTAYRDMDDRGDFVSILDRWDYNPSVYGGDKKWNKIIDIATGGEGFEIYDRFYLDDYYDIPEEFRGNPFISPAIITDLSDKTKQDLIDQGIPEEEWEFVLNENSFLNGGKFLTKRRK